MEVSHDGAVVSYARASAASVLEAFYRHWMVACLPMAAAVAALLISSPPEELALTAIWIQLIVYLLHEFEEHLWPGGFKDFIDRTVVSLLRERFRNAKIPDHDFPLNDRVVFWINISFIWIAFPVFALLAGTVDLSFGLFLPWVGIVNASLHILVAIAKRSYNPGLVASVFLNIPSGIWTLLLLSDAGVSLADQILYLGVALIGHIGMIVAIVPRIRRVVAA
jgi:Protein of unknown function with HXXEE motif